MTDMEAHTESTHHLSEFSYEQRALPYIENPYAYHKNEVLKPIDNVTISQIAKHLSSQVVACNMNYRQQLIN